MLLRSIKYVLLLAVIVFGCQSASLSQVKRHFISEEFDAARAGDLIFRTGTELVSDVIAVGDSERFSHVGVLIGDKEHWQVVHASPRETADDSGRSGVLVDDLAFFLAPQRAHNYAVYRLAVNSDKVEQMLAQLRRQVGKQFSFVAPQETNATYCTHLIWQAAHQAGVDLSVDFTAVNVMLYKKEILTVAGLRRSKLIKRLF